jgi:LPXTG-motif cell wall-anchored protein
MLSFSWPFALAGGLCAASAAALLFGYKRREPKPVPGAARAAGRR